ncbi:MAG: 30S ribosomal protein S27ae [Candidatus Aenigmatarchaeota archaeon]
MKHKPVKAKDYYKVSGNLLERTRKFCPKCTEGFLAQHKDRLTCGKCGYTEFLLKK